MEKIQSLLEEIYHQYKTDFSGEKASYIPELLKVDSHLFAIAITTIDGKTYSVGDDQQKFSLQSTSKPFVYGQALMDHGKKYVHELVGVEPSGEAFNSIIELETKTNRPFNPMVNSGAIAVSNMIKNKDGLNRLDRLIHLFQNMCGHNLDVNEDIFLSEKKTAHRNRAIAHLLRHFNVIDDEIEESLDLYFKQCSIMVNVKELSCMAATLANRGASPITHQKIFNEDYNTDMISLIFSCGMYDSTGKWAYEVGIPAKSGVSGAIFGVIPGKMGIAVYSPLIDFHGHSIRGINTFKKLAKEMNLNIFQN